MYKRQVQSGLLWIPGCLWSKVGLPWIPFPKRRLLWIPVPKTALSGSRISRPYIRRWPHELTFKLLPTWQCCLRGRLRSRCGRRWRGRRRPLHACLRCFRAGDFVAGADSDDESAQQAWMEMARHANCNPKSLTQNPNSMMQADSSTTLNEPVVSSTQLRRAHSKLRSNRPALCC